jgi:hypothetical protein
MDGKILEHRKKLTSQIAVTSFEDKTAETHSAEWM